MWTMPLHTKANMKIAATERINHWADMAFRTELTRPQKTRPEKPLNKFRPRCTEDPNAHQDGGPRMGIRISLWAHDFGDHNVWNE